jgi:membrane protein YqaA with SNARE-associated domain
LPDFLPALAGLAFSAFTSATILPGTSEAVLVALYVTGAAPASLLFAVASMANVAGSCINWLIGRSAAELRGTRWRGQHSGARGTLVSPLGKMVAVARLDAFRRRPADDRCRPAAGSVPDISRLCRGR